MTLLGCTPILWLASFIYSCLPIKKEWLLAGGNHLWISTVARVALMNKFYLFLLFFFAYPVAFDTVSNTLSIVDIYFYIVNCSYIFLQWPMHLFNMLHIHCGAKTKYNMWMDLKSPHHAKLILGHHGSSYLHVPYWNLSLLFPFLC